MATTITQTDRLLTADHGILDEKGRKVGGYAEVVELRRQTVVGGMGMDGIYRTSQFEATGRFGLQQQATRNGEKFGAYQGTKGNFATVEEALTAGRKALLAQGAGYVKKYAPKAA